MNDMTDTVVDQTEQLNEFDRLPSYLVAANNHNLAATDMSLTDYAVGGTGAAIGAAVGSLFAPVVGTIVGAGIGGFIGGSVALNNGKFAAASLFSGAASFYNTGVEISNWFGADAAKVDVQEKLTEFDSDLGMYYAARKESADLVGFAAGSLIPTVFGLKVYNYATGVLNAVKGGEIGANFSAATGLLQSPLKRNISKAIADMGAKDTPISLLNSSMLKAFGTGVAEEAIQGAFVSTAILSTMHASPVLEQMDAKDMAWNIVEGALINGVVGGVIRGAGIFGNIKTGVSELKAKAVGSIYTESLPENAPISHQILNTINNKETLVPPQGEAGESALVYAQRKYGETKRRIEDDLKILFTKLANNDSELGLGVSDIVAGMDIAKAEKHLLNVQEITRMSETGKVEAAANTATKKFIKEKDFISDIEADAIAYTQKSYLQKYGENMGAITFDEPTIISFADRIRSGQVIEVTKAGVSVPKIGEWKFTTDPKKPWNGIAASADDWEARNIWMNSKDGPVVTNESKIHSTDLPFLKRAYNKGVLPEIIREDGSSFRVGSKDALLNEIQFRIQTYKDRWSGFDEFALDAKSKMTNIDMAKRLDVTVGYIENTGVNVQSPTRNLFAMKSAAEDYTVKMQEIGRYSKQGDLIETWMQPKYAKLITDTKPFKDIDGNVLLGMAQIKERARLQQDALDNAVISVIGEDAFYQLSTFEAREISKAIAEGGPNVTYIKSANNSYGSLGSMFQQIGSATNRIIKTFHDDTTAVLNPSLYALKNNETAALTFNALMTRFRATPEVYYHDHANSSFVLRRVALNDEARAAGKQPQLAEILDPKAVERIPILDPIVNDAFAAHVARNGKRQDGFKSIITASGYTHSKDPRAVYAPPVNQKQYPHFAFVVNDTVTGTGHISTIYASSPAELETLIAKVNAMPEKLTVIRKDESERYKKALDLFNRDDTISESTINTALFRNGVSANFIPKTDPTRIVDDLMQWHLEQDRSLARYAISSKYSKEFDELNRLGEAYAGLQTSRVGAASLAASIETKVKNPAVDYIKTALNMTSTNESPRWTAINNFAEQAFTQVYRAIKNTWKDSYTAEQADKVNTVFENAGLKTAYYDSALLAHANHTAPVGDLTKFVSRANAILATLMLRMDPANAFVNAASSVILETPEIRSVLKAIEKGDAAKVGELIKIKIPGTGDSILSPMKLEARATKAFFSATKEEKDWYRNNGFMTRHLNEYQNILDDLTLTGTENSKDLMSKSASALKKFGDSAEYWTGNKFAEEFNRFKAAHMMKSITDIAVEQNIILPNNALSYINTFVNRTHGNYLASQRPLMFQGAVGQAIGLFQNYQFNMMQQLLRHVSEGASKDAAMILGMQATVYGMHGLPGFDYINNHIIGTMSGNPKNRDLYDATYGIAGKDAGNWLMYGMASNILGFISPELKANLYSRGDINPRQATVVPIDPAKIPIINASAKFFINLKDTTSKLAAGGDVWPTILQGIEHAGINRPLAGLAQTLEAFGNPQMQSYGTSSKGNVTVTNDLWSLANLTRLAGAKPLDEAIAIDAAFRLDSYKAIDAKRIQKLGQAIKTTAMGGNVPSQEQIEFFAAQYAAAGGKQKEFNQFMIKTIKEANTSHANAIANSLSSPHAQSMQRVMGGYNLNDFSN